MSATPATSAPDDVLATAVRALTAAARPESGMDFAEMVTLAVAAAVANVGGVAVALSRRSGSWEANAVQEMVLSTVGEDPDTLLAHRTEPLIVNVYPDQILSDLGYWDQWYEARSELRRRHLQLGFARNDPNLRPDQLAAIDDIDAVHDELDELQDADISAYGNALATTIRSGVETIYPSLTTGVEIAVHDNWPTATEEASPDFTWPICQIATATTPLPSSGRAPQDYPSGTWVAEVDRAAGRDPLSRIDSLRRAGSGHNA